MRLWLSCPWNIHFQYISMKLLFILPKWYGKSCIFFLDSDGTNCQIQLSEWWGFSYLVIPTIWFSRILTFKFSSHDYMKPLVIMFCIFSGNKCFFASNSTNPMDWQSARKYCTNFGTGYDIAAINNEMEQGKPACLPICVSVCASVCLSTTTFAYSVKPF